MIEAYPLCWPQGFQRTESPQKSRFSSSFTTTRNNIVKNIKLMGGTLPIISSNIPLRRDGLPYSGMAQPNDRGVAVYFIWKKEQRVLACDRWNKVEDNLHAIELALEAMRGLDRWGVSQIMERAFQGFTALPPPESEQNWWEILGVSRNCSKLHAEEAYKTKIKSAHPDMGGSTHAAAKLNQAIEQARN